MQQQQRNMQFLSLQKGPQSSNQKLQQRSGTSVQHSGAQSQHSVASMNIKTDQILNQLHTLACNTQAQTENTEKLQQRLQKSEETIGIQKKQNQALRMENGKIVEQLRLSKCSMEQLEVQVQTLVSNVEEQKNAARDIQEKLTFAETRYEESKSWKEGLEQRLAKTKADIQEIRDENSRIVAELKSEIESKDDEIKEKNLALKEEGLVSEKLRLELEDIKTKINETTNEIATCNCTSDNLRQQIVTLDEQLQKSNSLTQEMQARCNSLEVERATLTNKSVFLDQEFVEAKTSYERRLQEQILKSATQVSELEVRYTNQERGLLKEIESLQESLKQAELLISSKNSLIRELEGMLSGQAATIQISEKKVEKMKEEIESILSERNDLLYNSNNLEVELAKAIKDVNLSVSAKLEDDLSMEDMIHELETAVNSFEGKFEVLYATKLEDRANMENLHASTVSQRTATEEMSSLFEKKLSDATAKINSLEKQLREAEHRADEKIKHNLFEAQKHLNIQIVAMREDHSNALLSMQVESKALKERLMSAEAESLQLRKSLEHSKKVEEQNNKLSADLVYQECKVEKLTKELADQAHKFAELRGEVQLKAEMPDKSDKSNASKSSIESKLSSKATISLLDMNDVAKERRQPTNSSRCETNVGAEAQTEFEVDHESGGSMKKRALGSSTKGKSLSKRASKKQSITSFEAATVKKPASAGQNSMHESWDDSCAEFDLFGTSGDLH